MLKRISLVTLAVLALSAAPAKADNYFECMKEAGQIGDHEMAKCMNARIKDMMQELKVIYENTAVNSAFEKWNNGIGMQQGNFRDIYNNWVAYRDKFCSAYTVSMVSYAGSDDYNRAECVMNLTEDHLNWMKKLIPNTMKSYE